MFGWLRQLFTETFMPHGHCYLWEPSLVWLHACSDFLIGVAYVAITVTLIYLVRSIRDLPFQWMYLAFALFIVSCGLTHLMEVWNVWRSHYWLAGVIKALTAVASMGTALLLPPLVPKALAVAEAAALSHERGVQLETALEELSQVYERTKQLEELKTQFFANVSHELRTPLALIMGPLERWTGAAELPPAARRDLEMAGRSARTLLKHVNDLLDVSKLEAGKMEAAYAQVDLARLVRLTAAHFDGLAAERGIAYQVEAPQALPAQLDPALTERVLLNLLSNAFKFTPERGGVRVALSAEGEEARMVVSDSGPGIPADFRPSLFQRFRQAEGGSTRRFGGTGLGLAIVKDFVTLQGGTVAAGDAPGGGAQLTVTLPLTAPQGAPVRAEGPAEAAGSTPVALQALEELRTRIAATEAGAAAPELPLVLVVEDNPDMNRFLGDALGPEYRCERAFDGQEGLRKARELRPDLVISDVMMPLMSGDQMVEAMRADPRLDAIPVVMLTARADDELRLKLLREGAQDYLVKPFSGEELRARVRNLVTMKRARDVLQRELDLQVQDLERLAREATSRKRELETALETVRVARDHAEQASQLKSNFLSLVSHELRTPLSTLLLQLELLQRQEQADGGDKAEKARKGLERMHSSVRRLMDMMGSLLDFARVESGRVVARPEAVDLPALAGEVLAELQPQAERKQLELRLVCAPGVGTIPSDPRLLRTVLLNLVGNGVKFTEAGEVALELGPAGAGPGVELRVRDTGPGIPPDRQALVFLPFEQLEGIQSKQTPGFGLGLAIVKELVAALGGRIALSSDPGAGATFTVWLPPDGPPAAGREG